MGVPLVLTLRCKSTPFFNHNFLEFYPKSARVHCAVRAGELVFGFRRLSGNQKKKILCELCASVVR